jgi:hypothetical protein
MHFDMLKIREEVFLQKNSPEKFISSQGGVK